MGDILKNKIHEIIQKQSNCSKLNFDINIYDQVPQNAHQFPRLDATFKKIDIICSNTNFDSFVIINDEIKNIYLAIETIKSTHFVNFIFDKCYIKFWNENINVDEHIKFNECKFNVYIDKSDIYELQLLHRNFYQCEFEQISLLNNIKIVHIDLISISMKMLQFVNTEIFDHPFNKIELSNCEINEITIMNSVFKKDFTIFSSKINIIKIKNVDFESLSEFNEVTFQEIFDLREITFKGFTLFDKCIFNAKAEFEYIIFEKFASFRESTFNRGLNLDYTSGDKEINYFGINGLESNESKLETSRETYRIIKNNFEKNGNKIEANKYHALELDQKRRELEKIKWQNLKDYIVFKLHDLSSEHSTNWVLALLWIFAVGFLTLFLLHLDIAKDLFFHPYHFKIEYICKIFKQFFEFIYIGNMDGELKNNPFIFLLNKVSLGYLYYQFVTATRKDTRK
ncbi:pentapeptide repeat-containing protein [Sulfuricurvum sp.]|uniref:pentapeptide repeat-containing protein n=1 Tax=Sulfuricurvum sp. TaxID=2025608 RepID=UPI00356AD512